MSTKTVQKTAALRGIRFDGEKKWLNQTCGFGYEFFTPDGRSFRQADTLDGAYRSVMKFPKLG